MVTTAEQREADISALKRRFEVSRQKRLIREEFCDQLEQAGEHQAAVMCRLDTDFAEKMMIATAAARFLKVKANG